MIRYSLKCSRGHEFDSWFGSGAAYDALKAASRLSCAICGDGDVVKAVMAPNVATSELRPLGGPASAAEQALAELRRRIEAQSEDVGDGFAAEARRIHDGEAPMRPIIGEAKWTDAKALIEDGVPIAPLPWQNASRRKVN